jgi:hypothetical protein
MFVSKLDQGLQTKATKMVKKETTILQNIRLITTNTTTYIQHLSSIY